MINKSGDQPVVSEVMVKPGDIFYHSYGYEQTNVYFYQVLSLSKSGKSAKFRKIKGIKVPKKGMMSGTVTPDKDCFEDNALPFTKRITEYNDNPIAKMDYGSMAKWDGKPKHYSSYA